LKRFKKNSRGYVFDRLLALACLTPLAVVLVAGFVQSLESEYSFYVRCDGFECENPFWLDCPGVVEREAPGLCTQRVISRGEDGSRPGWAWDWLFPAMTGGFLAFFGLNHMMWNGGVKK